MGAFICKQPNGKYCRFSSIVDCPTEINMTREDYIESCMEKARIEAIDVLDNYLEQFSSVESCFRPTNMTRKEFTSVLRKMRKLDGEHEVL